MKKPNPPCGPNCPMRVLGCRSTCKEWQKYEAEMAVYRKEAERTYLQNEAYCRYREERYEHHVRAKGERRK